MAVKSKCILYIMILWLGVALCVVGYATGLFEPDKCDYEIRVEEYPSINSHPRGLRSVLSEINEINGTVFHIKSINCELSGRYPLHANAHPSLTAHRFSNRVVLDIEINAELATMMKSVPSVIAYDLGGNLIYSGPSDAIQHCI